MGDAFTTRYNSLSNTLNNDVVVRYNRKDIKVNALWDTGATNSCISDDVVKNLSLIATGKVRMRTPSGESDRNTYLVDILLPNNVVIKNLVVVDSEIGAQNIGMLIGMDIINRGDFSVSNYKNKTAFTFRIPSGKETDYVNEFKFSNLIGPKHGQGKRKKKRRK